MDLHGLRNIMLICRNQSRIPSLQEKKPSEVTAEKNPLRLLSIGMLSVELDFMRRRHSNSASDGHRPGSSAENYYVSGPQRHSRANVRLSNAVVGRGAAVQLVGCAWKSPTRGVLEREHWNDGRDTDPRREILIYA